MTHDIHIRIPHVTRVEGHGNIVLDVKSGKIEELRLEIVESPRFFEVMLKGRPITEVPGITSRICGICAISHTCASLRACEATLGITPSAETIILRKVLLNAEILQSHILHLGLLVLPDFFGKGSVIELAKTEPEAVQAALRLKAAANEIAALFTGRHVHPIGMAIGGFKAWPEKKVFSKARAVLEGTQKDLDAMVSVFKTLTPPPLERATNYVSLTADKEYALYDGVIKRSIGGITKVADYKDVINEEVVRYSTAKQSKSNGKSIMVGALSRLNNNFPLISGEAKDAAKKLGMAEPSIKPFDNNTAQLIECVHTVYDSLKLLERDIPDGGPPARATNKAGRGVGAVEAPRGTLYHEYETDKDGIVVSANCIIPTAQNLANIERDIEAIVPSIIKEPQEKIALTLEMLVRAYDPCISCSTHFLDVKLIGGGNG
ncbi:MAG: Ni/Fe hydrogenase subunit alpha [Deltaproteobacteria bacterium]|nr:Ni/Fe hydrogenase subunit alpha [Deltaproteobacteria bacterium]